MAKKNTDDWITQTEAAQLRGVTLPAINELVRRGRLRSEIVLGKRVVSRADVTAFKPLKEGRPAKKHATKKAAKKGSKK